MWEQWVQGLLLEWKSSLEICSLPQRYYRQWECGLLLFWKANSRMWCSPAVFDPTTDLGIWPKEWSNVGHESFSKSATLTPTQILVVVQAITVLMLGDGTMIWSSKDRHGAVKRRHTSESDRAFKKAPRMKLRRSSKHLLGGKRFQELTSQRDRVGRRNSFG